MPTFSLPIDDAVAQASSVLRRARLDGLDEAALPFAERHVQAWRGEPTANMSVDVLVNVWGNCDAESTPMDAVVCRPAVRGATPHGDDARYKPKST